MPLDEKLDVISPDENENEVEINNLELLEKFIGNLKEFDKALMLLYLEKKSHQEISEILGITTSNISTKIARIKEGLKQQFSNLKNQ